MTRIEAVARAIAPRKWDVYDFKKRQDPEMLAKDWLLLAEIEESKKLAQLAIEASDAWLGDRVGNLGPFKVAPYQATREMMKVGERYSNYSIGTIWIEMLKAAPDIDEYD